MLDFDLSKMALIGVVALIVLGPERLPRVARTAGALFGRAQRYADELKTQVSREMELDELRRMKTQFESTVGRFGDAIDPAGYVQRGALSTSSRPESPIAITAGNAPVASSSAPSRTADSGTLLLQIAYLKAAAASRSRRSMAASWRTSP